MSSGEEGGGEGGGKGTVVEEEEWRGIVMKVNPGPNFHSAAFVVPYLFFPTLDTVLG